MENTVCERIICIIHSQKKVYKKDTVNILCEWMVFGEKLQKYSDKTRYNTLSQPNAREAIMKIFVRSQSGEIFCNKLPRNKIFYRYVMKMLCMMVKFLNFSNPQL